MPVLLVEALELPIFVERANMQKPHAEYDYATTHSAPAPGIDIIIHIHMASTVCRILDED